MPATTPPLRCAYCHAPFLAPGVACPSCATALHADCWALAGACPTLGCGRARPMPAGGGKSGPAPASWTGRCCAAGGLALILALILAPGLASWALDRSRTTRRADRAHLVWSALSHAAHPEDLGFTPDGRFVVARCQDGLRAWSLTDGEVLAHGPAGPYHTAPGLAISPRSDRAAFGCDLRSLPDLRLLATLPGAAVAYAPDASAIAVVTSSGAVLLASSDDGREVLRLPAGEHVVPPNGYFGPTSGAFSPDGARLAIARDGRVRVWALPGGALVADLAGLGDREEVVAFRGGDELIGLGAPGYDGLRLVRWTFPADGAPVVSREVPLPPGVHGSRLALAPDGARFASTSWGRDTGGPVQVHRLDPPGVAERTLQTGNTTGLGFSPDGRLIATGDLDNHVEVWRVAD